MWSKLIRAFENGSLNRRNTAPNDFCGVPPNHKTTEPQNLNLTDRQLLIRAARGQQPAFTALYRRYGARLYAYFVQRLAGDRARAEDLKQQVFLKLLESRAFREAHTGPDDISSLLFTIAANLLKNEYRGNERRRRRETIYSSLNKAASLHRANGGSSRLLPRYGQKPFTLRPQETRRTSQSLRNQISMDYLDYLMDHDYDDLPPAVRATVDRATYDERRELGQMLRQPEDALPPRLQAAFLASTATIKQGDGARDAMKVERSNARSFTSVIPYSSLR